MGRLSPLLLLLLAAPQVDPPGTLDPSAESAYEAATRLRRQARFAEAAAAFENIPVKHPRSRRAVQALAAAASIHWTQLGEPEAARRLLRRAVEGPLDVPGALQACLQLAHLERKRLGPRGELALYRHLYRLRQGDPLAPRFLLSAARLLAQELDQKTEALALLDRAAKAHPESTYADDVALEEARLLRALRRPEEALAPLRRLKATKKDSFLVGEYDSALLDDAYLLYAQILAFDLARDREAEAAAWSLVEDLPDSILVDDALSLAAGLAEKRGDAGRAARAKAALDRHRAD